MQKLKIYTFEDLEFRAHTVIPEAVHARLEFPNGTNVSVVGGRSGSGLHGNGVDTFEVWYSEEEEPRGYQDIEEINEEFAQRSIRLMGLL
jgi:hypothetical protein